MDTTNHKRVSKDNLKDESVWKKFGERIGIYHGKLFGMPNDTMSKTEMLINILQDLSTTKTTISSPGTSRDSEEKLKCFSGESPRLDEILRTFVTTEFYIKHKELFGALHQIARLEGYREVATFCSIFHPSLYSIEVTQRKKPVSTDLLVQEFDVLFSLAEKSESSIFEVDNDGLTILHSLRKTAPEYIFHYLLKYLGALWETTIAITDGASSDLSKPTCLTELFNWPTNTSKETPLHYAVSHEQNFWPDILDLFLRGGRKSPAPIVVNLNAVDIKGNTALHAGLEHRCSLNTIKCLIEYGAYFKVRNSKGCNVVHICAQKNLRKHLKYFIKLGVNVNELDNMGNNALQCGLANLSEWYSDKDFVKLLRILRARANTEQVNIKNQTVFDIAKPLKYYMEFVTVFGVSVNKNKDSCLETAKEDQSTLFAALQQSSSLDEIKNLVNSGIDLNRKNKEGCNVAHICAQKCLPDHLEYFIDKGVNVNEVDSKGNNALQCALLNFLRNKFTETEIQIFLILEDAGVNKSHVNIENKTAYDIAKGTGRWCDSLVEMFKGDYTPNSEEIDETSLQLNELKVEAN